MTVAAIALSAQGRERSQVLFEQDLRRIQQRTDRVFMWLLAVEWVAGILAAWLISPTAWEGTVSHVHIHVYAAVYLGGLIVGFPIVAGYLRPGTVMSRHSIAVGQMAISSLLIHLSGGRIETHFHVFGSLAFLAMYRDWRVLLTASVIVAVDHFLRGLLWPMSVYGVATPSSWRWLEHVAWVVFEDVVLVVGIRQSLREMVAIGARQAALEEAMGRVKAADEAKGAFLAQMSHEIRTPMTAILGYADMMALEGGEHAGDPVHAIRRNGRHLLTVLDDILDFSKMESGQLRIEKRACDVGQLLKDVWQLMNPRAGQRGIELVVDVGNAGGEGSVGPLLTDSIRLRQIVLNLVSNGIKFTTEGEVRICAGYEAGTNGKGILTVSVSDTGIGLTKEQQGRLFQTFTQADETHHRRFGGTGLGLAISQRLAGLLGGGIEVTSEPGTGSVFTLRVAVERRVEQVVERVERAAVNGGEKKAPAEGGKRILVVDDSADNRKLLRRLLMHGGYEVEVADDGSSGMEMALKGGGYDLILMDMLMPNVDGYEATRQLRERGYGGMIVALTANVSEGERRKCREMGCDDYITKPFDCEALLVRIGEMVVAGERVVGEAEM